MSGASPALIAYRLITAALEPLATLLLRRRAGRGKEDPARIDERLGRTSLIRPPGPLLWLHGASVGESLSLLPLIEALTAQRPDVTLLVTSGTVTSAQLLAHRLPARAIHQYAPVDAPGVARRFLAHWRPEAAVFVESELWPNLLLQARSRGMKLALLGARLSDSSARTWRRAPQAARTILTAFDLILAQDAVSRARLEGLGAVVDGELDLKQAAAPLPCDEAELAALKALVGTRPVLVAASTHAGEEDRVLEAYLSLPLPLPLLVIVPRHPARGDEIADRIWFAGLAYSRRSNGEAISGETHVYLADTLGELGLFFRIAQVVVMGGSLTGGVGGHNPLEPARLGLPVITGPDVANFRETYAGLVDAHAALTAPDQAALDAAVADLMAHPARAREIGLRAKAHAGRAADVLAKAMAALAPLLPHRPTP